MIRIVNSELVALEQELTEVETMLSAIANQRKELLNLDYVIPGPAYKRIVSITENQRSILRAKRQLIVAKLKAIDDSSKDNVNISLVNDYKKLKNELKDIIECGVYNNETIRKRNLLENKIDELKKVINTEYLEDICDQNEDKINKEPKDELVEEIIKVLSTQCGFDVNIDPDDIQVVSSFDDLMNIINKGNKTGCKSDSERVTANKQKIRLLNMLNNKKGNMLSPRHSMTQAPLKDLEGDTLSKTPIKCNESPLWTDIKNTPAEDTEDHVSDKFIETGVKLMEKMIKEDSGFRSLIAQMAKDYDDKK